MTTDTQLATVEQWGIFELALTGSADGNPFIDTQFAAHFAYSHY